MILCKNEKNNIKYIYMYIFSKNHIEKHIKLTEATRHAALIRVKYRGYLQRSHCCER